MDDLPERGIMKSLNTLVGCLVQEAGAACSTDVSSDLETVRLRVEHEGDSFFTVTLPAFGKAFERSLANGSLASVPFPGFKKRKSFPLFLGGLLRLVFNDGDGRLLPSPNVDAIQGVRQICLVLGKLFEVCADEPLKKSLRAYEECDSDVEMLWQDPKILSDLTITASTVFDGPLRAIESVVRNGDLVPGHGPGATADRIRGNAKYDSLYWSERLETSFPVSDFLLAGYSHYERISDLDIREPGTECPVRVTPVPKTASKARIIAMEPANVQYCQQALLREFARVFHATSPFVSLSNQEHNRDLARRGSIDGSLATLDLSDASDRLALPVVEAVFKNYPFLLEALLASRSSTAELPDGRILRLAKFASMGSATCFPVEAICFAVIALTGIRTALSRSEWKAFLRKEAPNTVRVFGDDIIIPSRFVQDVMQVLCRTGSKPNTEKSFWTGRFRESCGAEFFEGVDVGVVRLRRRLPASHREASEVLALISFRNQLYMRGYWKTAALVDRWIRDLRIPMPIVDETSPIMGRISVSFGYRVERHDPDLQSPLVRGLKVRTTIPSSEFSDHGKLLKCLLPGRLEPFADPEHLTRSGRADAVATTVGWAQPF